MFQTSEDAARATRHYILALLFFAYVVAFLDRSLVGVAGLVLKRDLALTDAQFGLLSGTAFAVPLAGCGVLFGLLADRFSRRLIISGSLLAWSLLSFACGLSKTFSELFLFRMGLGLAEASLVPTAASLIASVVPQERIGRSTAIFLMGSTVGNAAALLVGADVLEGHWLVGLQTWRSLFFLAAAPGLVLSMLFLTIREPPRNDPVPISLGALAEALRSIASNAKGILYLTATTGCIVFLAQTPLVWAPMFYARAFGLPPSECARMLGVSVLLVAPLGQWLGGHALDRLRCRGITNAPIIVQMGAALVCLPAGFGYCLAQTLFGSLASLCAFIFAVSAAVPAGLTGWQLLAPARSRALLVSMLVSAVTLLGFGLGPPIVGLLSDVNGSGPGSLAVALLQCLIAAQMLVLMAGIPGARALRRASALHKVV